MSGGPVLVLIEHDRGVPAETAFQAFGLARGVADQLGGASVEAVVIGADGDDLAAAAATCDSASPQASGA